VFSKYYLSELAYLRDMGKSFSLANPSIAGFLAERGGDPDVARLLEGFAFLTARIRERVDDAVPEVLHGLVDLLLPHYLRPVPACSIVEFTPQMRALRGRQTLPAGTQLASTPVDGTACQFRTSSDLELLPLTLVSSSLDATAVMSPRLKVTFQTTTQGLAEVLKADKVRMFLHGDLPVTSMLLLWLQRHCKGVAVKEVSAAPSAAVRLPATAIRPCGNELRLFPWPDRASTAYRSVQELFTLPQKFLFFDVVGLSQVARQLGERFELTFEFDRPPPMPARVGDDVLKLHCVPVVNLFKADADPIRRDPLAHESLLRAASIDPGHMEVYSVETVTGIRAGHGGRYDYPPFFTYSHATDATGEHAFFRLRRELSPINDGVDTYLSIVTPAQVAPALGEETLSVELICTNRSLPARLQVGDIKVPTASSPTAATFRNLIPVTKPLRPPFGSELHWRLLSHLALNQRSLGSPEAMRALLSHYNFQAMADHPVGRANALRVEAIRDVQMSPVRRFMDRAPLRGMHTTVQLEEAHFAGVGDAFLFGSVLDDLLAESVTLNSFNELSVRLQPSQLELSWPARSGTQTIL
jgi:type VI secretion system protein ImpG